MKLISTAQGVQQTVFDETTGVLRFAFFRTEGEEPRFYTSNNCTNGVCSVSDPSISIFGNTGDVKRVNLLYKSDRFVVSTWFLIKFRECARGEIFSSESLTCEYCNSGYYVLNNTCFPCPDGGICHLGVIRQVNSGYWRNSTDLVFVLRCNDTSDGRCLGESSCTEGFAGTLWKQCDIANGFLTKSSRAMVDKNLLVYVGFIAVYPGDS